MKTTILTNESIAHLNLIDKHRAMRIERRRKQLKAASKAQKAREKAERAALRMARIPTPRDAPEEIKLIQSTKWIQQAAA